MGHKAQLQKVGLTQDGKTVVAGVYKLYETHGLPLAVVFSLLEEHNMVPCWLAYLQEATSAGLTPDRAIRKVEDAIADAWGGEFRDLVVRGLELAARLGLAGLPVAERRRRLVEYADSLNLLLLPEQSGDGGA